MTGQPPEGNVGVNLGGHGDIDMWTGPMRAVGRAVVGVSQDLGSSVPGLLAKIAITHKEIDANITGWDETSAKYMEQENEGRPEFVESVEAFPGRVAGEADKCFASVDRYVATEDRIAQRMGGVSGPPTGPASGA